MGSLAGGILTGVFLYTDGSEPLAPTADQVQQRILAEPPFGGLLKRPTSVHCRAADESGYFDCSVRFAGHGGAVAELYGYDLRVPARERPG